MRTVPTTVRSFSQFFPFWTPPPLTEIGVILGKRFDGRPMMIHPWRSHDTGDTKANLILVTGGLMSGKSTIKKKFAMQVGGLQAGVDANGKAIPLRLRMHGFKHEGDYCENLPTIQNLRGTNHELARAACNNPFTCLINLKGEVVPLSRADHTEIGIICIEDSMNRQLLLAELKGLMVIIAKMHNRVDPLAHSLPLLTGMCDAVTTADVRAYDREFASADAAEATITFADQPHILNQILAVIRPEKNVVPDEAAKARYQRHLEEVVEGIREVKMAFQRIQGADYGQTFNLRTNMYEFLAAPVANWDWFNMTPRAFRLWNRLQWKFHLIGLSNPEFEHLIMHADLSDEGHAQIQDPVWASLMARTFAMKRNTPTCHWLLTQFITQFTGAGDWGTFHRTNATNILNTVGGRIVGPLGEKTKEGLQECEDLGYSRRHLELQRTLEQGEFSCKFEGRPSPDFFRSRLTRREVPIVRTTSANDRFLKRVADFRPTIQDSVPVTQDSVPIELEM
jgi:hypothetical protein